MPPIISALSYASKVFKTVKKKKKDATQHGLRY